MKKKRSAKGTWACEASHLCLKVREEPPAANPLQRVDLYNGRLQKSNLIRSHLSASAPFLKCQSCGEIWLHKRRKILVGKKKETALEYRPFNSHSFPVSAAKQATSLLCLGNLNGSCSYRCSQQLRGSAEIFNIGLGERNCQQRIQFSVQSGI